MGVGGYLTLQERKIIGHVAIFSSLNGIEWTVREKITGALTALKVLKNRRIW